MLGALERPPGAVDAHNPRWARRQAADAYAVNHRCRERPGTSSASRPGNRTHVDAHGPCEQTHCDAPAERVGGQRATCPSRRPPQHQLCPGWAKRSWAYCSGRTPADVDAFPHRDYSEIPCAHHEPLDRCPSQRRRTLVLAFERLPDLLTFLHLEKRLANAAGFPLRLLPAEVLNSVERNEGLPNWQGQANVLTQPARYDIP